MSLMDQKRVQAELYARRLATMVATYRVLLINRVATTPPSESSFVVIMPPPQAQIPNDTVFPKPEELFGRVANEMRREGYGINWTPRRPFNIEVSWSAALPPHPDEPKIEAVAIEVAATHPAPPAASTPYTPSGSFVSLTPKPAAGGLSIGMSTLAPAKVQFSSIFK